MSQLLQGGSVSPQQALLYVSDADNSDLYQTRFFWTYQRRGLQNTRHQNDFFSCWPRASLACGDPTAPLAYLGQDASDVGGAFELPSAGLDTGYYRPYYMRGLITDSNSNIYAGANLFMFLTSTNTLVATGVSDQNGNYSLPTIYNAAHYVVAQYSNTLVGTTLNTITPAL